MKFIQRNRDGKKYSQRLKENWLEILLTSLSTGVIVFCVMFFIDLLQISPLEKMLLRFAIAIPWAILCSIAIYILQKSRQAKREKKAKLDNKQKDENELK